MVITRWSIDYIIFSQRWRNSVQSAKTRPGADCGSDHELLIAKFRLKLKKVGKNSLDHSVQFSRWVVSNSLQPHESQHVRPPVHHQLPEFTQTHVHQMPSSHLIICCPLLLLPPIPPSIRVFSNESIQVWPKSNPLRLYGGSDKQIQEIGSDRLSAWRTMDEGLWHCAWGRDQDHPQEKEIQKGKMVVGGGLRNS